ncbi:hypothetical protein BDQ17DRAFT_962992 [Cyathus striatus]|nr:hypothetical protein BDQ17DRAFT_962992 [Cyathus striatus]
MLCLSHPQTIPLGPLRYPKPNRASLTEAEEPLLSTSTHLQSDPLFLSSSSPSSSSPPLSEPPPRMQLARKSTGGGRNMVRKRTMHSSRRALRSFEAHSEDSEAATGSENNRNQRDLPVSSSEITIPSFVSIEPKGNLSESYDLLPSTSEVTPSTTDDLPTIPTRKDKGKARLNLNSHGAGRQSIADAINLAGASNAQSHGRRKSRVESRAGATTAAAPSTRDCPESMQLTSPRH